MTSCLTPVQLLLRGLSAEPQELSELDEHVRGCVACSTQLERLRERLATVDLMTPSASAHLDDIAMAELLDAETVEGIGDATLAHVARCEACAEALRELSSLALDPAIRGELDRPDWRSRSVTQTSPPVKRRVTRVAIGALAAAALLLLGVRAVVVREPVVDARESARYRHATIASAAAPRLLTPSGAVARVDTLRWTSVPKADRYRVTVFDASGGVSWEAEGVDTSIAVPSAVASKWSGELRWRVKARTGFDRWVDSEFGAFSVRGGR